MERWSSTNPRANHSSQGWKNSPGQVFITVEPLNHLEPPSDLAKRVAELERLVASQTATLEALAGADQVLRRRLEALEGG